MSVTEAWYGDAGPATRTFSPWGRDHDLERGLRMLGFPESEIEQIVRELTSRNSISRNVLDTIIVTAEAISNIHLDNYPFPETAFDEVAGALT